MPPLNHAVLSASSAYRWLECPPSALATADIPDETTIYAQEGSAAHEMAEYKIRWHLGEKGPCTSEYRKLQCRRNRQIYGQLCVLCDR